MVYRSLHTKIRKVLYFSAPQSVLQLEQLCGRMDIESTIFCLHIREIGLTHVVSQGTESTVGNFLPIASHKKCETATYKKQSDYYYSRVAQIQYWNLSTKTRPCSLFFITILVASYLSPRIVSHYLGIAGKLCIFSRCICSPSQPGCHYTNFDTFELQNGQTAFFA